MRCVCGWRWRGRGSGSWRWRRLGRGMGRAASGGSELAGLVVGGGGGGGAGEGGGGGGGFWRAAGELVQAVWFDAGAQRPGRLLLTIHHLAVDGVSWRILVPELAAAWAAIARGEVPALTARGTSFRRWSQRLELRAQDAACVGE